MKPPESFLGQPIRSLQTMLRVLSAYDSTLPTVVPDGIYGQNTFTAVTSFQRRNGLPATGVVNQQTWDTIVAQYLPALIATDLAAPVVIPLDPGAIWESGDEDTFILLVQSMLYHLSMKNDGVSRPPLSGVLDESTQHAVRDFQKLNNLPQTGEIDRLTWKHLSLLYSLNAVTQP